MFSDASVISRRTKQEHIYIFRFKTCEYCGKVIRANTLREHVLTIHKDRVDLNQHTQFLCAICSLICYTKIELNK